MVLGGLDTLGVLAVENCWVVVAFLDGSVVLGDGANEALAVDIEAVGKLVDGVGLGHGDLLDVVFVAEEVLDLVVENLEGDALGLLEDFAAVGDVGVVAEVGALVDEAVAVDIDDEAERVGVLLEELGDDAVAKGGGR